MRIRKSLNVQTLRRMLGSTIYYRALDYYEQGYIQEFRQMEGSIIATVKGSNIYPYHVELSFNKDGHITSAYCNCPYDRLCKHIGAVLIHASHLEETVDLRKTISNFISKKQPADQVISLDLNSLPAGEHSFIPAIENTKPFQSTKNEKRRFKLIFLIKENRDYPYGSTTCSPWNICPAALYIKRDGSFGRVESFSFDKITEAVSETENNLLQLFNETDYRPDDLLKYLEILIDNPSVCPYIKCGYDHIPFQVLPIESTILLFRLYGLENDAIYFSPQIKFLHPAGTTLADTEGGTNIIRSGFSLFCIDMHGTLLYKKSSPLYTNFICQLLKEKNAFLPSEITVLKDFVKQNLKNEISVEFTAKSLRITHNLPTPFVEIHPAYNTISLSLYLDFKGRNFTFDHPASLILTSDNTHEIVAIERNRKFEALTKDFYDTQIHKILQDTSDFHSRFYYEQHDYILPMRLEEFLIKHSSPFLENNFEIRLKGSKKKISSGNGRVSINLSPGIDWFDLELMCLDSEGKEIPIQIDQKYLDQGLVKTGESFTILTREDIDKIKRLHQEGMNSDGHLRFSKLNLSLIDELYADIANKTDELKSARKLSEKLRNFQKIKSHPVSKNFNGRLRNYQKSGYNWLLFLHEHAVNGCLADDMGLGKTVQTLALLQKLKDKKQLGTCLLVVPVSTIPNWENEIKRFTPELTYIRHAGDSRIKETYHLQNTDLTILSYHTLRNDIELFRNMSLDYIILDESQKIKNSSSQSFKAVRSLKSRHRLSLTGTPVENSTLDLWSQMDFLNPGLLGTLKNFKTRFARPIESHGNACATEKLREKVFPFILRRKKEDVEKELPEKEIITVYSEMGTEQQKIYNTYRETYREKISATLEEKGVKRSAIEIFEALLRLRQIALFPVLADSKLSNVESCKFDSLKNMLDDIFEENHKMLLFSQFVKSLKIIENHLQGMGIKYSYLDGATKRRDLEIEKFQQNDGVRIFLLSLKAGGLGINLTAADYVILFDPWWNPAVESQAIDRTHRIGQEHKVIAYKLIVKNTVEEKILKLQEKKNWLVKELVKEESSFFKSLSKEDVINLFN